MWGLIVELVELERPAPWRGFASLALDEDGEWALGVNRTGYGVTWRGLTLPPHGVGVSWQGWPVGLFSPDGGYLEACGVASQESLEAALQRRIDERRLERLAEAAA